MSQRALVSSSIDSLLPPVVVVVLQHVNLSICDTDGAGGHLSHRALASPSKSIVVLLLDLSDGAGGHLSHLPQIVCFCL